MATVEKLFKKRSGTSGISGHLYETKLISLILYRLLHDKNIEQFDLASNMDDVGAFDDICLKLKITGYNKPILVFIQAKHKDEDNTFLNYDLIKNFHVSLLKVKEQFSSTDKNYDNVFFTDSFFDTECIFILYTNAKFLDDSDTGKLDQAVSNVPISNQAKRQCEMKFTKDLNVLIGTNKDSEGFHLDFTSENLDYIAKKILEEELTTLAEHFTKFLNDKEKQSMNIMHDEYMIRYNVVLRQINVVEVSEVQPYLQASELEPNQPRTKKTPTEDWRYLTFEPDFFETDHEILSIFRNKIYEVIIKNRGNTKKNEKSEKISLDLLQATVEGQISSFLNEPSAISLSYLIDTYIIYKNGKLEFLGDRPNTDKEALKQIKISHSTVYKAQTLSVKYFLQSLKVKVPVTFGNLDMTLKGNQKKKDKRIARLCTFLVDLCKLFKYKNPHNIVTIGEDIEEEFLSPSGGIGGAVGNLLVHDNETKLMKFTVDSASLQKNAGALFDELAKNITDLHSYRFCVKAMNFPKLVFDCTDEAKVILDKLLIFEKQRNQAGVEEILVNQIKEYEKNNTTETFSAKLEAVFVHYHHEIQQWWMSRIGKYLTKNNDIYQMAVNNILAEPHMCALQNIFFSNMKHIIYTFNENALQYFDSLKTILNNIIVTDVASLMAMKVLQYLRNVDGSDNREYMVLDIKYTINLPVKDFRALNSELSDTEKIVIVICDGIEISAAYHKRLLGVSQALEVKEIIIITTKDFNALIDTNVLMEYFSQINNVLDNEKVNINDLTPESRLDVIENVKVIFQGEETSFKTIMDDDSFCFIGGILLNKIIANETINIGDTLSNLKYEEIKQLYVNRRVSQTKNVNIYVRTFVDIKQDCVLITAEPGMGKSILLTHLSLKTKELIGNIWISRINLLDHSKEFHCWQKNKTKLDALEVLKFLYRIQLTNKELPICLKETNDKIYLGAYTGDDSATFELNMFLHFYNNGRLILLFDGFDEICPHYKNIVLDLFNVVKKLPQKCKMWVTSRPYNEILPDLEVILGKSYKILYITNEEQEQYLYENWYSKLPFEILTDFQLSSVISFADCILDKILTKKFPDTMHFTFHRMYYLFYNFVQTNINKDQTVSINLIDEMLGPSASTSTQANELVDKLVGTPLLLYLVADYFIDVVNNMEYVSWDLNINIIKVYESFVDTKLKKILFEDKNKMDVYMPDVITRYEKARADCIAEHKKLGAHVILKNKIFYDACPLEEFKDMQPFKDQDELEAVIDVIKTGTEKTGLISHVTLDGLPVFIHRTFAEYFAIEYLCDIFESNIDFEHKRLLFTAIYTYGTIDIRPWLHEKRAVDKYIDYVINSIIKKKPVVLTWHRELFSRGDWGIDNLLRLLNSCPTDYEVNWCRNVREDFVDILNNLDPEARRKRIRNFQTYVIAKMKPHLKQYFGPVLVLRGYKQMINWMGGKILLP